MMKNLFKSGAIWIWLNAAAVSCSIILVVGLLILIAVRGLAHFWPTNIHEFIYEKDGVKSVLIAEWVDSSVMTAQMAKESGYKVENEKDFLTQYLLKSGNRDISGLDFRWIEEQAIVSQTRPPELMAIERREWGNFYGRLKAVKENGQIISNSENVLDIAHKKIEHTLDQVEEIEHLQKHQIGSVNYRMEKLRLEEKGLQLNNAWNDFEKRRLEKARNALDQEYQQYQKRLNQLYTDIRKNSLVIEDSTKRSNEISLDKVVRIFQPNKMDLVDKFMHFFEKFAEFVSEDPREANTEGGIFPAIFGTVMMVMLMAVFVTPFGVIAAVYLREYAKQGFVTRLIRIAVNNLAGVPSIVYGVFGLGFFVYILGGSLDDLFYPEAAPAPVFGTPGLLWASLTLALLTLPVVIVSTEEGLSRVPKSIREGSLALGATKAETLWRTVLPMASPAMMTGLILAVARAAGEVAPLMLVGVVKLAPTLPMDGNFPFIHLERKFMHLGFHIYDVGFQSPNVEAARPLVYATSLLLVLVIIALNLFAIAIRNNLREKFRALEGM